MSENQHICKSCGNSFKGSYCNECGEKIVHPSDRSFKKFLNNMMLAVTLSDNKFFKSLWLTITNPGFLSKEITEGRTIKHLRPMSVFFVLNLVYFLFPLIQLFNASFRTQLGTTYSEYAQHVVAVKAAEMKIPVTAFEVLYNQKSAGLAKLMVIIFAILASLPLNLFYSKRNRYFNDHVGLMVELACFNLFVNALVMTFAAKFLWLGQVLDDNVLPIIFIITNLYFLLRASFTFYKEHGVLLVVKSLVMIGVLRVALEAYRFILFLVTVWAV